MKMGCVNSKADINDTHPNIFHVINVNDQNEPVNKGKLEVTEVELIWHQKGSNPTIWPLKSLRKYGWDLDRSVFSIECGRRSPTGPGYFAFRCIKAEQLFKLVQLHILGGAPDAMVMSGDNSHLVHNTNTNNIDFSVHGASTGPPVQMRSDGHSFAGKADATHLNPVQPVTRSHTGVLSRPGSISSNGQLSPTALSPPPVMTTVSPLEHNNNKRSSSIVENGIISPLNYANFGPGDVESNCHVYVNVDTKEIVSSLREEVHCYANIDTRDVESIQILQQQHDSFSNDAFRNKDTVQMYMNNSVPCTPIGYEIEYAVIPEVNYAELDLEEVKNDSGNYPNGNSGPAAITQTTGAQNSPSLQKKSYAMIDFPKTIALSQSINPNSASEEGSRKTRHNSTINS